MRIALITPSFPDLSITFVLNQVTGLIDRGHEVDIYALFMGAPGKVHDEVAEYSLMERTTYIMTPSRLGRLKRVLGLLIRNFHKNPLAVIGSFNFFKYGMEAIILKKPSEVLLFLDAEPYDIIHCHFGPTGNVAAHLKSLGVIDAPIVTTFHGFDMTMWLTLHGENTYNELFMGGDLFLPISDRWRRKLIKLGCPEDRIRVHHMGVDTEKLKPVEADPGGGVPSERGRALRLLTVARLVEVKGVRYGIEAVGELIKRGYDVEYRIAGQGDLIDELRELVSTLGIGDRVKILGGQTKGEVFELLRWGEILIGPSVTDRNGAQEGGPVAFMEAMSMGLPVVSTNYGGIPEIVSDGVTGILTPERDVAAIAEAVARLIDEPALREGMGKAGREYILEHYNIEKENERLIEIFGNLLEGEIRQVNDG